MSMETDIAMNVIKIVIDGAAYSVNFIGKALGSSTKSIMKVVRASKYDSPRKKESKEFT